jgi:hypothetical protein
MKIPLGDFNAKLRREDIFKRTSGNENLHEDGNDNGVKVVKYNAQLIKVIVIWQIFHF